ncbi:transmembrane protein 267 [Hyposmocoma kahamanoa]|uniref:transmembrane protein 267 n=1 Tax=Hyposmocoma kahamanoa TaxID=1477025 RepID=UPI000E6D9FE8|nr:transmembrane protein 267 [Hyposmocoma kahamanoa]
MRFIKCVLTLSILSTALIGDYVVFKSTYSQSPVFRAVTDSLVHASIGFLSSLLFFSHDINVSYNVSVLNIIICTFVSSLIDIDHAVLAKSVHLKDMVNLRQRGFLHCTSLWLLITTILLMYSYVFKKVNVYLLTFMLIIAYSSHHIRDANRRGIWLYPFGHTAAVHKYMYIFLICALPYLYALCYDLFLSDFVRHVVGFDYKIIV